MEGFQSYLKNTFEIDIENYVSEKISPPINLNGCDPCTEACLRLLGSELNGNQHMVLPILVGENLENVKINQYAKQVAGRYECLFDKEGAIFRYETGLSYPLFIHIKIGECIKMIEATNKKTDLILSYLKNL